MKRRQFGKVLLGSLVLAPVAVDAIPRLVKAGNAIGKTYDPIMTATEVLERQAGPSLARDLCKNMKRTQEEIALSVINGLSSQKSLMRKYVVIK